MVAQGMLASVLLILGGTAEAVSLTRKQNSPSPRQASFRSLDVPYDQIAVPRGAVSSLPIALSLGRLWAFVPDAPVTGDLLVFLAGTAQSCGSYSQFMETIAGSMRVLCLPYDNVVAAGSFCGVDNGCYPDFRLEAFNGSFAEVRGNNIEMRLASALRYLAESDGASWSEFLDAPSGAPLWSRIRLAGHSQGAGAAAFIGYHRELARVVQFSGVCDLSDWTAKLGPPATPASRFFGLASRWDVMVCDVFKVQLHSWQNEGALPSGTAPLQLRSRAQIATTSLGSAHFLISHLLPPDCSMADIEGGSLGCFGHAHASTVKNIWKESPYADGIWQELCGV